MKWKEIWSHWLLVVLKPQALFGVELMTAYP
jgi:hypothetical protein